MSLKLPNLNELLTYHNQDVIDRFCRNFPSKAHLAPELFRHLLCYLWLTRKHEIDCAREPENKNFKFLCVMHQEMLDMDELWHCFILFTRDYMQFCEDYFGGYIHHVPNVRRDNPQTEEEFERDLERYLGYVYDNLGESTLKQWFEEYISLAS